MAQVIAVLKNGTCNNHRLISMVGIACRICAKMILQIVADSFISEEQSSFRNGRSCTFPDFEQYLIDLIVANSRAKRIPMAINHNYSKLE